MTLTSRTVIALVIVLATLGCHGSSVPSSPSGALCARLASLCASDASANELTRCERDVASGSAGLDAENVALCVTALLMEQRVLLHSERPELLTPCCEALAACLFPLCWQHVFVPLLPLQPQWPQLSPFSPWPPPS
jgi:hypothetical protein